MTSRPMARERTVPRRRWGIAFLLGFGVLVNFFDRVNLSVSQAALHEAFGISTVTFGFLLSAYSWTYGVFQLPSGLILDRFGVKLVGRIGTLIWSVASFAAAISTGLAGFLGARLLLGVGEAPTFPGNAKAVGYWFPAEERSLATAIFDSAAKLSSAIGVPLLGILLLRFGWRWSFAATGFLSLLYFFLFFVFYRNPSEDKALSVEERNFILQHGVQAEDRAKAAKGAPFGYLLRQRKVWGLVLGFASYNYTFYLLLTWMPSYLSSAHHVDLLHSALYTSVPWLFATFTDILMGGWLVDKLIQQGRDASLCLDQRGDRRIVRGRAGSLVFAITDCPAGKCGNSRGNYEFRQPTFGDFRADRHGLHRVNNTFVFLGLWRSGCISCGRHRRLHVLARPNRGDS